MELEEYKIINTAHKNVCDWIDKTVDASWRSLAAEGFTSREVVQTLHSNVSQTNDEITENTSQTYIKTLKIAGKSTDPRE